jgi:hypothetical protein
MKTNQRLNPRPVFGLLAAIIFASVPLLQADVVVLQSGAVITGNILQQDADGVLLQMEYGTFRYPLVWIRDVKKEPAAAPHVANNGKTIPDWAQIVTLLANNTWAPGLKQVPATMIESGVWKNVPYVSFRCAGGGYELNIFGDLNQPAAVQIGAMNYLHQTSVEKSNCVNFICSVLANAADRKIVRALNFNQNDSAQNGALTFATVLPGEWGSYGGWWISVCDTNALAGARASAAELAVLAQPRLATTSLAATNTSVAPAATPASAPAAPAATTTDSGQITSEGTYSVASGWTAEELAAAHPAPATAYPTATTDTVYPRTYTRAGGSYGLRR